MPYKKKPKKNIVEKSWGIGTAPILFFFIISIYALIVLFLPRDTLPFSGVKSTVFVIAASIITYVVFEGYNSFSLALAKYLVSKLRERTRGYSPLAHHVKLANTRPDGHVYLVRRFSDKVYKIGASSQFEKRFRSINRNYGPIYLVALWEAPDYKLCEKTALGMTSIYEHYEDGRKELRSMTDEQTLQFINEFSVYILSMDVKKPSPQKVEVHERAG